MKVKIDSLEQTKDIAQKLAKAVKKCDVIELQGDLGAGKTTFSKYFINSLLDEEQEILSPTFNLVHPYETSDFTIWHFDLYRIEDENEAEELGIYDAFDYGVSLIEWSQIISGILPENRLLLEFNFDDNYRYVTITGYGNWIERLDLI